MAADTPRHRALSSVSRAGILALIRSTADGLTAAELARLSGLHPSTVRAHLDQLVEAALVAREPLRQGAPGRPAWRYRAIAAAEPTDTLYRDLAAALVDHVARAEENPAAAGEQAGRDWGRRLAQGQGAATGARRRNGGIARAKPAPIDGLVGVLDQLGFTPKVVSRDDDTTGVVHLRTCPFMDLVAANPDVVCGLHLGVIRGALGGLGASTAGTDLEPFAAEGACVVRISTDRNRTGHRRR